jgi:hypothetical protein
MYLCHVWLTKYLYFPKQYAATDLCNGDAVWDSRAVSSWKILYRPDNQWPLLCAGQPQKKRTVAPLELSVGASRVDTCWRVAVRTWEDSKNRAMRSCIQPDKLYRSIYHMIKEQSKVCMCLSPHDCKEISGNPSYTSVLNRNCFVTLGAIIR